MNNPYYVQPANLNQGLGMALSGIADYRQRQHQKAELDQKAEQGRLIAEQEEQEKSSIISRIAGKEPEAIYELMQSDQKLAEGVMKGQKFVDEASRRNSTDEMMRYLAGEDVESVVKRRAESVKAKGGDPTDTLKWGMAPKERRDKMAEMAVAINSTPEQWERYQQITGKISADKAADIDIKQQTLGIRKLENKERALDRQIARESNDVKRQALEQRMAENRRKIDVAKNEESAGIESARGNIDNMLNTVDEALLTPDDVIEDATGPLSARLPTTDQDTADFEEIIKTIDAQAFLAQIPNMKGMGALSEAEGNKLAGALKSLSLRQSSSRLKSNLQEMQRLMLKARQNISRRHGVKETVPDTPSAQPDPQEIDDLFKMYGE